MLPAYEDLVEIIKTGRKEVGLSQRELAKKAGLSKSVVGKFERMEHVPNYKNVKAMYDVIREKRELGMETAEQFVRSDLITVSPNDKIEKASGIMKEHDFSQIPVEDDGHFLGLIQSNQMMDVDNRDRKVSTLDYHAISVVPSDTPKENFKDLLKIHQAVLVKKGEKVTGIITPADLL